MKPMRLKAVLRETWRNVATGTSRCALISLLLSICAVACMCADLTQMTGLIGDARKWKESGASTYAITLQGGIDGAACEGLRSANGVLGAAALRQSSDRVRIASLPATEIPTYEASAHVAQVFAATGIRKDNSGVIMSTAVARTYGAHAGTVLPLSSDILLVGMLAAKADPLICLPVAAVGNWLGAMTSYWLGWYAKWEWLEKWFRIKPDTLRRQQERVDKYGVWLAVVFWAPFIGMVCMIALGVYKVRPRTTALLALAGSFLRFSFWILLQTVWQQ